MADLVGVLGNLRLAIAALAPIGAAIGLAAVGRPVANPGALVIAPGFVAFLYVVAALWIPKRPWDGRFGALANIAGFAVSGLALAFVIAPWDPAYDNLGFIGVELGFTITGALVPLVIAPVVIAQQKRGVGPFKKLTPTGGYVMTAVYTILLGPIIGSMAGLPLLGLWTAPVLRACPHALAPAVWMTAIGVACCALVGLAWIAVTTLSAYDKRQRAEIMRKAGFR